MNFTEYQELAKKTAIYPSRFFRVYPALGLCGEAGEVAEKIKKSIRDGIDYGYEEEFKADLTKELGDVLWFVAQMATELKVDLEYIAETNIKKLASRAKRGKIKGSGDNR